MPTALGLLAAALVVGATVIVVWTSSPRRGPRVAAVAGANCLGVGLGLFVLYVFVTVNHYDEQARPGWLTALGILGSALAVGGLLAIVSAAIGAAGRKARQR